MSTPMNLPTGTLEEHPKIHEIATEIKELKEKFADTPDVYREVCALLFFRYGVTPTANKLYQLVRRGSMSAPSEALRRFWENLRDKSRMRIEHPDLPPELAETAGELMGNLWQRAQSEAERGFAAGRRESLDCVQAAQAQAQAAETRAEAAAQALFQLQAEFSANLTRLQDLERALAKEQGVCAALQHEVAAQSEQHRRLQEARIREHQDFESRIAGERRVAEAAEATQRLELDRLRTDAARDRSAAAALQRERDLARADLVAQALRHEDESRALQKENAVLGEQLLVLRVTASEVRAANDVLRRQLDKTQGPVKPGPYARRGKIAHRSLG